MMGLAVFLESFIRAPAQEEVASLSSRGHYVQRCQQGTGGDRNRSLDLLEPRGAYGLTVPVTSPRPFSLATRFPMTQGIGLALIKPQWLLNPTTALLWAKQAPCVGRIG